MSSECGVLGMIVVNANTVVNVNKLEMYKFTFSKSGADVSIDDISDAVYDYIVSNMDIIDKVVGLALLFKSACGADPKHVVYGYVLNKLSQSGMIDIVCDTVPVTRDEIRDMVANAVEQEINGLSSLLDAIKAGKGGDNSDDNTSA